MDYITRNPNFEKILNDYGLNLENSNFFQHAFKPNSESDYDMNACISFIKHGLSLKNGFNSFLATMSPYSKHHDIVSQIEQPTLRGDHKIIICIPHQLEDMVFGTKIDASGDAGNQYNPHILLDYLIKYNDPTSLPSEFIMGMYFEGNDLIPPAFIENPKFFKNKIHTEDNIKNLKKNLLRMVEEQYPEDSYTKDLLLYCFGEKKLSQDEITNIFNLINKYYKDSKYQPLKQAAQQKFESLNSLDSSKDQPTF